MELQRRIAKPVSQFGDLRAIAIIQVLARAENLDQRNAGVPNPIEPYGRQAMPDEEMRGKRVKHLISAANNPRLYHCRGRRTRPATIHRHSRSLPRAPPTRWLIG